MVVLSKTMKVFLVLSFVLSLLLITHTMMDSSHLQDKISPMRKTLPERQYIQTYVSHDPILIESVDDFEDYGFPGSGSATDPYIIQGYEISSDTCCIEIRYTDAYFQVRNCLLDTNDPSSVVGEGIRLVDADNAVIVNNLFSGFRNCMRIVGSPGVSIADNLITDCAIGLYSASSSGLSISNNTFTGCGILLSGHETDHWYQNITTDNLVNGFPIGYFWNANNVTITGSHYGQIILANSTEMDVTNNYIERVSAGISLGHSSGCFIQENEIVGDYGYGISLEHSSHNVIQSNNLSGMWSGIYSLSATENEISNNTSTENYNGIYLHGQSDSNVIKFNMLRLNTNGLAIGFSSDNLVFGNSIYQNTVRGIFVITHSERNMFTNNTILSNQEYDVHCYSNTENNVLFFNIMKWEQSKFLDDGLKNHWNNSRMGNYWTDIVNVAPIRILGSAISRDYFPFLYENETISPTINHPEDVELIEGTIGNTITWVSGDENPYQYIIYDNGSIIDSDTWNGSTLVFNMDSLRAGVHYLTVYVFDTAGNWVSDTASVTVFDLEPPSIDGIGSTTFEYGAFGELRWFPYDKNPERYAIYQNGTEVVSGSWNGTPISYDLDDLNLGLYNFTLVVFDITGNSVSDTIFVTIVDTTPPSINHPIDVVYEVGDYYRDLYWSLSEFNPSHYLIYVNGELHSSDVWDGHGISFSYAELGSGVYNITIVVYDEVGNSVVDTVIVTVIEPFTYPRAILALQLMAIFLLGIAIVFWKDI